MEPEKLIETLAVAERLKDATRHCYTSRGRRESVAEHSWRITLMAYLVSDEFPEADLEKLMKMCLIHDLGEAFTGDIPTFEKSEKDEEKEASLLNEWVMQLPEPFVSEMQELYRQMEERKTLEARISSIFSRTTPEALFRMWRNASYSPWTSEMKCSVPLGRFKMAWRLTISVLAA